MKNEENYGIFINRLTNKKYAAATSYLQELEFKYSNLLANLPDTIIIKCYEVVDNEISNIENEFNLSELQLTSSIKFKNGLTINYITK